MALCMLGLVGAMWTTHSLTPARAQPTTQQTAKAPSTTNNQAARDEERLKSAYAHGQDQIATDQKTGHLTSQEASKLQIKLTELYNFRKSIYGLALSDTLSQRSQKHQELHAWAQANHVSDRYFLRLY